MQIEVEDLVGGFVVEIGVRQAWPFLTFVGAAGSVKDRERRLFIDTTFSVTGTALVGDDELDRLRVLSMLNNSTVTGARVWASGELILDFDSDDEFALTVSGEDAAFTTQDILWPSLADIAAERASRADARPTQVLTQC